MQSRRSVLRVFGYVALALMLGGLGAVCWTQERALSRLREQQRAQEEQLQELTRLRSENKALMGLQSQQAELERLREDTKDVRRLRNEITQLRRQIQELEVLRAANAQLLQAFQNTPGGVHGTQAALVTSARKLGAILGINVRQPANGRPGAEVFGLDASSPVSTSGLAVGDIVFALDGQRVQSPAELQALMLSRKPGEFVSLDVLRNETPLRVQVQTRAWPQ